MPFVDGVVAVAELEVTEHFGVGQLDAAHTLVQVYELGVGRTALFSELGDELGDDFILGHADTHAILVEGRRVDDEHVGLGCHVLKPLTVLHPVLFEGFYIPTYDLGIIATNKEHHSGCGLGEGLLASGVVGAMQDTRLNNAPEPAALTIDHKTWINGAESEFQLLRPPVVVNIVLGWS